MRSKKMKTAILWDFTASALTASVVKAIAVKQFRKKAKLLK